MAPRCTTYIAPSLYSDSWKCKPTGGQAYVVILGWGPCTKGRLQGGAPVNVSQVHWYERVNHESKVGGDGWGEEVCTSPWPGPGQVKEDGWMDGWSSKTHNTD